MKGIASIKGWFQTLAPLRRRELATVAILAALFLLLWLALPKGAFWGIDSGLKYAGSAAFAQSGSIALPYDGATFDALGKHRPIPLPFSVMEDGKMIPTFPVLFMVLGGVLHFFLGRIGPFLLPLIGGWLMLVAAWILWQRQRTEHDGRLYLVLVGAGSPLLFYSLSLWEYSIAAALVTLSVAYTSGRRGLDRERRHRDLLIGGIFIGLACGFRSEAAIWVAVTLLLWKNVGHSWNSAGRYLAGMALALVPCALLNIWQTGHPLPLHIGANYVNYDILGILRLILTRAHNLHVLFFKGFDNNLWSLGGLIPLLVLVFWGGWRREEGIWIVIGLFLVAAFGWYYSGYLMAGNPVAYTVKSGGLLWVAPMAGLALLPFRGERRKFWRLMLSGSILYALLVAGLAPTVRGVHWGPRFLVPILPLILIVAATRAQRWWRRYESARPILILLVVLSIITQGLSFHLLQRALRNNQALDRWVASTGSEVSLTTIWWLPGDVALQSAYRPWYLTDRGDRLGEVVAELRKRGVKRFNSYERPPYISEEFWWRTGCEIVGSDHHLEGDGRLRRTWLRVAG
ncbi:MAG: hypothetical protein FJY67_06450 [Calditrichaeota bacterium]|nr:hypothetical protein [Calditrichota bacterium]